MRSTSLLLLFLIACLTMAAQAGTPMLILSDTANAAHYAISREVEIFEDKSNSRSIEEITALPAVAFIPLHHPCCNFGYERNTLWLRFRVGNKSHTDRFLLEVVNPFINRLTFFETALPATCMTVPV